MHSILNSNYGRYVSNRLTRLTMVNINLYLVDTLQHWVLGFPIFSHDFAFKLQFIGCFPICFNDFPIVHDFPTVFSSTNHHCSWFSGVFSCFFWPCFPYLSIVFSPSKSSQSLGISQRQVWWRQQLRAARNASLAKKNSKRAERLEETPVTQAECREVGKSVVWDYHR